MKKTEMLKKNYEFKTVLSKGKFFIGKEIEIFLLKQVLKINFLILKILEKLNHLQVDLIVKTKKLQQYVQIRMEEM